MSDLTPRVPMLIGGQWREAAQHDIVRDPYRNMVVCASARSTLADLDDALEAAVAARDIAADTPAFERAALLRRVASRLAKEAEALAYCMSAETGKALKDARAEISRSIDTLIISAEEAVRIQGEHVPLDSAPMGVGKLAVMLRFPVGVVAAITPFNAPINLVCHKIGPAIAAGNTVVLKPPPQASLTVHRLVEIFVGEGIAPGVLNVVYGNEVGPALVQDARVDFISFTGSTRVGLQIKQSSGLRRVALELGGIGPVIVHEDADIAEAALMCARNSVRLAGQSCVSVQVVHVHRSVADQFADRLVQAVRAMKVGDPLDPETDVGPMIDERAAQRVGSWVAEAVSAGAVVLTGGAREGALMQPTVMTQVRPDMKVACEEAFGPIVSILPYDDVETVFDAVSESRFGLQCGLFTRTLPLAMRAIRRLRTGGVVLNGTSTWRVDSMPYGGVKDSGIGREGPRYVIKEMTEERLAVFNI